MSKNKGLGLVSALAVGAGVAAVAAGKKYKTAETKKKEDYDALHNTSEYRNTERGKYEKNSKGIYYTNGNYEAFARPRKPEGVDDKHAYIVGSGLASLYVTDRCQERISTFWKQWILQAVHVTVSLIRAADM